MAGVAARAQPLLYYAKDTRRIVVAGLAQLPQPCKIGPDDHLITARLRPLADWPGR